MPVHLDIRPCWTWQCPHCPRKMHYPTSAAMQDHGINEAVKHLADMHNIVASDAPWAWIKDHWPRITECK